MYHKQGVLQFIVIMESIEQYILFMVQIRKISINKKTNDFFVSTHRGSILNKTMNPFHYILMTCNLKRVAASTYISSCNNISKFNSYIPQTKFKKLSSRSSRDENPSCNFRVYSHSDN